MEIVFASNNINKFYEMEHLLSLYGIKLIQPYKIDEKNIIENGDNFKENAIIKAKLYAEKTKQISLADDSGIIIDSIKPLPGIYSKRYSGLGDDQNNQKVLTVLENHKNRSAKFVCVIAIACPDGKIFTYEGTMSGKISFKMKGDMGFGYDPIFIPTSSTKTLGELGPTYKNQHSHRRHALNRFLEAKDEVIDYWRHSWQK